MHRLYRRAAITSAALTLCLPLAAHAQSPQPTALVELTKTPVVIEFDVELECCPGKKTFAVQDGAMSSVEVPGHAPVRFIVKQQASGDVLLHLVADRQAEHQGHVINTLHIKQGVSILNPVQGDALKSIGLRSVNYRSAYPLPRRAQEADGRQEP